MLTKEANGVPFSKTQHRNKLLALIKRSAGSIEFKHQNISAVLFQAGLPYISGYKPRHNFQVHLKTAVHAYLEQHPRRTKSALDGYAKPPLQARLAVDIRNVFVEAPNVRLKAYRSEPLAHAGSQIDYAARDEANKTLGKAGEQFVVLVERARLSSTGRTDLAKKVRWSASEQGDGLGYDVLSFDEKTGENRYIEVKTTNSGAELPFHLTIKEVDFGQANAKEYRIYRVFGFKNKPQIFVLKGAPEDGLDLKPTQFRARLKPTS